MWCSANTKEWGMSDNVEIIHNVLLDKIKVTSSIFVINIAKIFIERDAFFFWFGRIESVSF